MALGKVQWDLGVPNTCVKKNTHKKTPTLHMSDVPAAETTLWEEVPFWVTPECVIELAVLLSFQY